MAQNQNLPLSLENLIPGGNTYPNYSVLQPKNISWWGDRLIYIDDNYIKEGSIDKKDENQNIVSIDEINNVLAKENKKEIKSLKSVSFPFPSESIILIANDDQYTLYDIDKDSIINSYSLPENAANIKLNTSSKVVEYTLDNNLHLMNNLNQDVAITNDQNKAIVNGQAVHRNEFGINSGTFWAPNAQKLAFYRMDESMVGDYPLVDIFQREAALKDIKYPMAGMNSHEVTLGIFDTDSQETIFLETGTPKDKYLTNVSWSPDSKYIYIAELNRGQDTCQVKQYDANTGNLESILFTETHPKYVEPEDPILFLKNNPTKFIWQSKRDGFNHLYLYNTKGKLEKKLTSGKWDITEVLGFDDSGKNLFYISTEGSPIDKHIYKLDLETLKRTKLSNEEGVHNGTLSSNGKYIVDKFSSMKNPLKINIIDTNINSSNLFFEGGNPFDGIDMPEISLGKLKANDGKTDLYYRLVKPTSFDSNKKYPVIVYVYGGPHSQLVDNSWMGQARGWDIYMAEKGYIIFTLDNRGTSNRGLDFENITHRQLGVVETEDQMTGIDYLTSLPYVDKDRIGVHGWSFGGFMTLNLMLRHPEIFKVGVAGGPVTDWKYYEIMYGERYMDSPEDNAEGYAESSMVERAKDLKGRLMLIHGDQDPVVVMQHSLQFLNSAIKNGTHPDFFIYPGHQHNMVGHDRVHLHEHITRYFDDFLK